MRRKKPVRKIRMGLAWKKNAGMVDGMKTPREILQYVGIEAAANSLGVSVVRVDRAQRDGKLPASWLDALERLARRPLDRAAFAFKGNEGERG